MRSPEARRCMSESRLLLAPFRPMRAAGEEANSGLPAPRAPKWPVCGAGYRTPKLRFAVGAGPACSHFSFDSRHPSAEGAHLTREQESDPFVVLENRFSDSLGDEMWRGKDGLQLWSRWRIVGRE